MYNLVWMRFGGILLHVRSRRPRTVLAYQLLSIAFLIIVSVNVSSCKLFARRGNSNTDTFLRSEGTVK